MVKNTPITKDWFMLGATTGFISCVLKNAALWGIGRLGHDTIRYDNIAGGLIMGKRAYAGIVPNEPKNRNEWIVGSLADWTLGTVFGVFTSYIHTKTPPGNNLVKGALGGAAWWMGTITLGQLFKFDGLVRIRPEALLNAFLVSVVYGMSHGYVFGKYGSRLITQAHPVIVTPMSSKRFNKERMKQLDTPGDQLNDIENSIHI